MAGLEMRRDWTTLELYAFPALNFNYNSIQSSKNYCWYLEVDGLSYSKRRIPLSSSRFQQIIKK
jgi:hypothetical protein